MPAAQVVILDKDISVGTWVMSQLQQINIQARWVTTLSDLLAESEVQAPLVVLIALRPPIGQALTLMTDLTQEPRFAETAFIPMGVLQYKHQAYEAGADDFLIVPPDVIELRKRVRLHLEHAELQTRVVAETRISQEIELLASPPAQDGDLQAISLLEHLGMVTQERLLLEMILGHIDKAVALVSPDGIVLYANAAWEQANAPQSVEVGELIPWPPTSDHSPETNAQIAASIMHVQPWQGTIKRARPGGGMIDLSLSITPASEIAGELVGFILIQSEISSPNTVEGLQARYVAEAAQQMRTPIAQIKTQVNLARQAAADQRISHLQIIEREADYAARLFEAITELSYLESEQTLFAHDPVNLVSVVLEVVNQFSPAAREQGITLAMEPVTAAIAPVSGDPAKLTRALSLVVDNALHYTPGGGLIELRLGQEEWTGGQFVTLQVQDTGIGIAPEEQALIFDRFYRSPRARDRYPQGIGLGLAMAQAIVTRHDGSLTVESQLNQGCTFTLWLAAAPKT